MKKIIIFTPSLNIGGVEKVLLTYAALLNLRDKYEVIYLVCHMDGDGCLSVPSKLKVVNLNTRRLRQSVGRIVTFLRNESPDYLFVANSVTLIALFAKWLSCSNVRIITSHHYFPSVETNTWLDRWLVFKSYNLCHKVIAISHGISDLLKRKGVKNHKIIPIYNPINVHEIVQYSQEKIDVASEPYVLFVGRLAEVKNIKLLIDSVCYLHINKRIPISLIIVGDGPERGKMEAYANGLGLKKIHFVGAKSNPYPYICNARIVALASLSEAFPTILLESLALGRTVVSTPTIGAAEILRGGRYGYLTRTFDSISEYAHTLEYAYNNPIDGKVLSNYVQDTYNAYRILEQIDHIL